MWKGNLTVLIRRTEKNLFSSFQTGQMLNGHHLLEFSNSVDNQTSMNTSKIKIRLATLWIMMESPPNENNLESSENIVQLHKLSHNHKIHMDEPIIEKFRNQPLKTRRKRKRKGVKVSDSFAHSSENHSYNHITKKDDDNHIIKSNRNERKRRKVKSINLESSNKLRSTGKIRHEHRHDKNLTLWIFRINNNLTAFDAQNLGDEVKRSQKLNSYIFETYFNFFRSFKRFPS